MLMQRPDVIFVMSDDHAAKAISAYIAGINDTPHLDRIAKEEKLYKHCYVTSSIRTPSRATILSGQHNHVNGVFTHASCIDNILTNVAKLRTCWNGGRSRYRPAGTRQTSGVPGTH